jgi:hypothetical protein
MEDKYIDTIEDFMKSHPDIDPSLKQVIQPTFRETEDQFFNFIMSFIFM